MDILIDDFINDFEFSNYSTATTTTTTTTYTDDKNGRHSNDWSPVVDWGSLSGGQHSDFHDLIESMMDESELNPSKGSIVDHEMGNSNSMDMVSYVDKDDHSSNSGDSKGLRLVHLLMAAAEALTSANKNLELARVILIRLKELVSPVNGSNMERLAAYFTDALQSLLEGARGVHGKHFVNHGPNHNDHHQTDVIAAFQLLQDMSPYVKFGHFTANQAILEAVAQNMRVHIVDYNIMEGIQWASLMQALASRKDGPPTPHLRITALSRVGNNGRRMFGTVQETGRRLVAFADSMGLPFSFHQCKLDSDETFKPSSLKSVRGEALVINCMLHLPHFSYRTPDSLTSFLSGAKTLNPRLVTLVEEEAGSTTDGGFVSKFMDTLHHYSALYDSLEAGFPLQERARAVVERVFLGPIIAQSVARIYRPREKGDGCGLGEWLRCDVGYVPAHISFANHCQAKLLLGLFNDGYRVEELANNRLVLGWKSRRLLSATIWTSLDSEFVN